jgi:L-iditol 2-dehydrogenase
LFTVSYAVDRAKESYSLANEGFGAADTVVIQGVGPMGLAALTKSRILGAGEIIAIDKSDFRLNMAKEFTADHALNIDKTSREERIEYVKELTHGRGADLVVECTGSPHAVIEGLDMLRKGGTYIEAGNFVDTGTTQININRHLCAKNVRLFGVTNHPFTHYGQSMKLMEQYKKTFPFEKFVTHRYKIEDAEKGLRRSFEADTMKVVIEP